MAGRRKRRPTYRARSQMSSGELRRMGICVCCKRAPIHKNNWMLCKHCYLTGSSELSDEHACDYNFSEVYT